MTNLDKIQNHIDNNADIEFADFVGEMNQSSFLYHIQWKEGVGLRNGSYDVEIDENDVVTILDHIR